MRLAFLLPVVVALLVGLPTAARATITDAADLPALVAGSDTVVLARVTRVDSAWDETGMRIRTRASVAVEETLAGTPARELSVVRWGGTVGELGQVVLGESELRPGDRVLLFLERAAPDAWRTVGLAQGCWAVTEGPDPMTLQVSRKAARLTVRVPGQPGRADLLVPDRGEPLRAYGDVRAQVQALSRRKP